MDNVNLNALRVFAVAARHGSFQRAAEMLNISHGAVSQRVKQLESDLGVILFDRKPRGVSLTPKGRTYFDAVEEAITLLHRATEDLTRPDHKITLHIGASSASKWLMPRMGAFNSLYPEIILQTEVHSTLIERNLGRNEIALWPAKVPAQNAAHHIRRLCELRLVAVCSPGFARPDSPVALDRLLTFSLLQDAHRRWERLIDASGHAGPHRILNFGSSALALDAAIQGHGIALVPTMMVETDARAGHVTEIWQPPTASGEFLFLSWPRQHAHDKPLRKTVSWILSEFAADEAVSASAP